MMEFHVRAVVGYRDLTVTHGDTTIEIGLLDKDECASLINALMDAAHYLDSEPRVYGALPEDAA